jgi:hypothetical protein
VIGQALAGPSVVFIALLKLNAAWFRPPVRHAERAHPLLGNVGAVLSAAPLAWLVG